MSDHTIDVGPVWCPSCKREFGSTERDAEVSALRAALERIAGVDRTAEHAAYAERNAARIARDALGRYPKEASDG